MALPSYPDVINYKPDLASWRILELYRPPIYTQFEDGPDMARPSGKGRRARVQYRIPFTRTDHYETFRTFVEYTLINGTQRFTMPVYIASSKSYATRECQIEHGSVQVDPFGTGFAVSFILIIYDW